MDDDRVARDELADRLRDERHSVTFLLYRLAVSRLLLAAEDRDFAPAALREADRAMELWHDSPEWLDTTDDRPGLSRPHEAVERRQAALHALARALPPSLVGFLR